MSTPLQIDDDLSLPQFFLYYMSGVGGLFGMISISLMLIHIAKYFCINKRVQSKPTMKVQVNHNRNTSNHSNKRKLHKKKNPILYYIVILYLISGILICFTYSIIRSNIITRINIYQFTIIQCSFGYYFAIIFNIINKALMYSLFFYRLKIMFKNSIYEYSNSLFKVLFIMMALQSFLGIIFVSLTYFSNVGFIPNTTNLQWILRYHNQTGLIYCAATNDTHWMITTMKIEIIFFEMIFTSTFMYMFVNKLYILQNTLMKRYMEDIKQNNKYNNRQCHLKLKLDKLHIFSMSNSASESTIDINGNDNDNDKDNDNHKCFYDKHLSVRNSDDSISNYSDIENGRDPSDSFRDRKVSIETITSDYNNSKFKDISKKQSIDRIIKLHKLIKKKTILACITVISSLLYWLISSFYTYYSTQIVWDVIINSLCVWLMFGSSNKYWNITTNYCCCYFCYKDVNNWNNIKHNQDNNEKK